MFRKIMRRILLFMLSGYLFVVQVHAQESNMVKQTFENIVIYQNKDFTNLKKYRNQNIFLFLYKKYLSSQDGQGCSFIPSCSVYGVESVKKKGLILGILNTFDRLSRCNNPQHHLYKRDERTQLLCDPVE